MKNCDWLELGPELAIDTIPLALCFRESVISSLNFPPELKIIDQIRMRADDIAFGGPDPYSLKITKRT